MKVGVGVTRKIVVDGKVDTLDINTTTEDVGSDTDTLVEFLELLVTLNTTKKLVTVCLAKDQNTYRSS